MASKPSPAVIDERAFRAAEFLVTEESVVYPERVIEAIDVLVLLPLLPVQPPEVHALALQGADDGVEVGIGPLLLAHTVRNAGTVSFHAHRLRVSLVQVRLFSKHIVPGAVVVVRAGQVILHKGIIAVLVFTDAGSRMKVQGGLETKGVEVVQEAFRVREEFTVPTVSGPSPALAKGIVSKALLHFLIGVMPVHIHYHHIHGDTALAHLPAKVQKFLIRENPVSAPPIAKGVFRRHRNAPCNLYKVSKGGGIVVPVSKYVPVNAVSLLTSGNPVLPGRFHRLKQVPCALIHNGPSVP